MSDSETEFLEGVSALRHEYDIMKVLNPDLYTENFVDDFIWCSVRNRYMPSFDWVQQFFQDTSVNITEVHERLMRCHAKFDRYDFKSRPHRGNYEYGPEDLMEYLELESDSDYVPESDGWDSDSDLDSELDSERAAMSEDDEFL